ncbi:hypothetical protein HG15A2_00810 [Adhaeretor mobilis]|uniref:Uncharacterized protein n=2 Tax=Adhaeretor mobilis TaxID=1930276 RepID=A0A517MPL2_9BACT|nr:hypothetical protein HG15A2_00810 [Adhaeretor mobilis]
MLHRTNFFPQNRLNAALLWAAGLLSVCCFTGCWEEIRYQGGQQEGQTAASGHTKTASIVEPTAPPLVDQQEPIPESAPESQSVVLPEALPAEPGNRTQDIREQDNPNSASRFGGGESEHETISEENSPGEEYPKQEDAEAEVASPPVEDRYATRDEPTEILSPEPIGEPEPELETELESEPEPEPEAESELTVDDLFPVDPPEPSELPAQIVKQEVSETEPEPEAEPETTEVEAQDDVPEATMKTEDDDDPFSLFDDSEPAQVETPQPVASGEAAPEAESLSEQRALTSLSKDEEIGLLFGGQAKPSEETPTVKTEPAPPAAWELPARDEPAEAKQLEELAVPPEDIALPQIPSPEPMVEEIEVEETTTENEATVGVGQERSIVKGAEVPDPNAVTSQTPEVVVPEIVQPKITDRPSVVPSVEKQAAVWQAASRWSMALALRAKGMKPATYNSAWNRAAAASKQLAITLPPVPVVPSEDQAVSEIQTSMIEQTGPQLWQAIERQHGVPAGDLAQFAVRTNCLLLNYSPRRPQFAGEAVEFTRLAEAAGLPPELWQPLVHLIKDHASFAEVKGEIFALHKQVAKHFTR